MRQQEEAEQQTLILEYEQFRQDLARRAFGELPETNKRRCGGRRRTLRQHESFERIPPERRQQEADDLILQDLARHGSHVREVASAPPGAAGDAAV